MAGESPGVQDGVATIGDVLRLRAREQPDREAFTFLLDGEMEEASLTYAELDQRARAIAAQLQSLAAPGDRALLLLPSGLDYPAAFYGCLYAGLAVVPFYPPRAGQTIDVLESALCSVQATALVTTTSVQALVESSCEDSSPLREAQWVMTDALPYGAESQWQKPAVTADSLACLLLTSGSTSAPKGVMVSHTNVLHNAAGKHPDLGFRPEGRLVYWGPLHASASIRLAVVQPVYTGFPTTFMSPAAFLERPVRWLRAITQTHATHSLAVNFAYDLCAQAISADEKSDLDLSSWELAVNSGEQVRAETLERFTLAFEPYGFRQDAFCPVYGMSEALLISASPIGSPPVTVRIQRAALERDSVVPASEGDKSARAVVGCGLPLDVQRIAIVDPESHRERNAGEVGEIWISGESVAGGYWNRPEETNETFQAYLTGSGDGPFLRSGDLGFVHDGELFITGRVKELVIIRGRNLYPQDIELTAGRSHPALQGYGTAAFAVEIEDDERLLVVQEIGPENEPTDLVEIAGTIRRTVAEQHEVQVYSLLLVKPGQIPRTASGKIRRAACRAAFLGDTFEIVARSTVHERVRPELRTPYEPPQRPVEQALAEIWKQVLCLDRVGIHDNFAELGGDSLLSMQIMARINEAGLPITPDQLFRHPTIAELAIVTGTTISSIHAEQGPVTGPVPLTPRQIRLCRKSLSGGNKITHMQVNTRERLDPVLLKRAVQEVVAHHDNLRMRFTQDSSGWSGFLPPTVESVPVSYIDMINLSDEEQSTTLRAVARDLGASIDLSEGPPIRVAYFDRGTDAPGSVLLLIHHMVIDFYSYPILLQDLETAYRRLECSQHVNLPPKTTSFKYWAERLTEYAHSSELQQEADYWMGLPWDKLRPLPVDYPEGAAGGTFRYVVTELSQRETEILLQEPPRRIGARIDDALAAGLALGCAEWTGSPTLLVDVSSNGRQPLFDDIDLSRTVGWFQSIYPLVVDVGGASRPVDALMLVKRQLDSVPSYGIGYDILRHMADDRYLAKHLRSLPDAGVSLNYHSQSDHLFEQLALFEPKKKRNEGPNEHPATTFARLKVSGPVEGGRLLLRFRYNDSAYRPETVERVAEDVRRAMGSLAADLIA